MYKWNPAEAVRLVEKHRLSGVSRRADRGAPVAGGGARVGRRRLQHRRRDLRRRAGAARPDPPDRDAVLGQGLARQWLWPDRNHQRDHHQRRRRLFRPSRQHRPARSDLRGHHRRRTGQDVLGDGEIGELWVRGPNVIPGYWQNPEATEAAFGGGWFRTGDLGYRSAEGLYYVVDRKKDVVIRGGENVYCAEVEAAHPRARDGARRRRSSACRTRNMASRSRRSSRWPMSPRPATLPDELRAMLLTKLARFKVPTSYKLTTRRPAAHGDRQGAQARAARHVRRRKQLRGNARP